MLTSVNKNPHVIYFANSVSPCAVVDPNIQVADDVQLLLKCQFLQQQIPCIRSVAYDRGLGSQAPS